MTSIQADPETPEEMAALLRDLAPHLDQLATLASPLGEGHIQHVRKTLDHAAGRIERAAAATRNASRGHAQPSSPSCDQEAHGDPSPVPRMRRGTVHDR